MTSDTTPNTVGKVISDGSLTAGQSYYAFDGNDTTKWLSSRASDCWIGYQFNKEVKVNKVGVLIVDTVQRICTLQYSDDGTNWTPTEYTITPSNNTWVYVDTPNTTKHKYWRLHHNVSGSRLNLNGLQFYGS